jgi:membrane-associated phospholipid phosphatase
MTEQTGPSLDGPVYLRGWRWAVLGLVLLVGLVAAHALDMAAWQRFHVNTIIRNDLFRLLRVHGYAPGWFTLAAALVMIDWPLRHRIGVRGAMWRGWCIFASVAAAGILAELLKLVIRRTRPPAAEWDGAYVFRPFSEMPLDTTGLGMPSSHTCVAFAGAWMLCRLFPRASVIWLVMAGGCGATRIIDNGHYLSDVYVAAAVTFITTALLWRYERKQQLFRLQTPR